MMMWSQKAQVNSRWCQGFVFDAKAVNLVEGYCVEYIYSQII
ncbi:hypothetical protein [Enterovibrio sp. 27052020O]